jgi:hypothetical protein
MSGVDREWENGLQVSLKQSKRRTGELNGIVLLALQDIQEGIDEPWLRLGLYHV